MTRAIQIKYLSPTNTQDVRYKAFVSPKHFITEARNYDMEDREQAYALAEKLIQKLNWLSYKISGFGTLPNGDYVATLVYSPSEQKP